MKLITILYQLALLYGFYWMGGIIQQIFHLFIPGSIIGMLLLFVLLVTNTLPVRFIESGTLFLLRILPLLFIPVTVGLMDYFSVFAGSGILSAIIAFVSTICVMASAGLTSQFLVRRQKGIEHTHGVD
jgi:holin-like protein